MITINGKKYLSLPEAAERLTCSKQTIYRRIESGAIMGAFKDGKFYRIPEESINNYWTKIQKIV